MIVWGTKLPAWIVAVLAVMLALCGRAEAQGSISLDGVSASPTNYSAAGQVITYTYVVTNTGMVNFDFGVRIQDDRTGTFACAATLNAGQTRSCSATYVITAADLTAGSVTSTARAIADSCGECEVTSQARQTTVIYEVPQPPPPETGAVTIVVLTRGGNGAFGFSSSLPAASGFVMTTGDGSASRTFPALAPGTYVVAQTSLPAQWQLSALSCIGDANGTPTTTSFAGRSVSIGLDGRETITCTFVFVFTNGLDEEAHRRDTQAVIRNFLAHRVRLLAEHEPDRNRLHRRIPGMLWGEPGGPGDALAEAGPVRVSATSSGMSWGTSLARLRRAEPGADARPDAAAGGAPAPVPRFDAAPGLDVWSEAHYARFEARSGALPAAGWFGLLYLGADYLVTPAVLAGGLISFDWAEETGWSRGRAEGRGFMAGPYLSVRLAPSLYFDARAAWGKADNAVNPFDLYWDGFATSRELWQARLTGTWHSGRFRVTPTATVSYVREVQQGYSDSLAVFIPEQAVALGRLSAGPEFAYRFDAAGGASYEPFVAVRGNWDFDTSGTGTIDGVRLGGEGLTAMLQAGLLAHSPYGMNVRVAATLNGLGRPDFRTYGAQAWVNVPLR